MKIIQKVRENDKGFGILGETVDHNVGPQGDPELLARVRDRVNPRLRPPVGR